MELKNFYICVNENREATVRVEAHDLQEAYDRLNSAYAKDVIELDSTMMIGADMEDITEPIAHNGWYHGRTVDLELPYDQVLSEESETTASEETAEKRCPKYKTGLCFSERDLYLEDIADQIVGLLADSGVSHAEWEQVSAYVRKAIEQQRIQCPDGSGEVQCI